MAVKKKDTEILITIPGIETEDAQIHIVGQTPLICHAWSDESIKKIYDKLAKKASNGKDAIAPMIEYSETLYWITGKPESYEGMSEEDIFNATQNGTLVFQERHLRKRL